MILPEGAGVDTAIVDYLNADATLAAALPDGAYYGEAPPGAKRFLVVDLVTHEDVGAYGDDAYQTITYLVRAIALSSLVDEGAMQTIASQLYTVLHGAQIPVAGYAAGVTLARVARIRATVPDLIDKTLRWYYRGGQFVAHAS
jgi:hypothetical protein